MNRWAVLFLGKLSIVLTDTFTRSNIPLLIHDNSLCTVVMIFSHEIFYSVVLDMLTDAN